MKKIFTIGMVTLCALSLSACSQNKDNTETKESTTQSTEQSTTEITVPERTLTLDENVTTNILGYFKVEGQTEPNSEYTVDYGTLHKVETSDDYGGILIGLRLSDDVMGSPVYVTVNEGTDKEIKKEAFATHSYDSYMRIKRAKGE
ncbi:hypothetical protein [Lactococcus garvieae]|uniref:hypothetical protein n=1 Tax=Lactococcus garvieae TaxID=1363 RepID=UPI001E446A1B|nr:hypothetical protein [Lactococcus garvieae]MDB7636140.1 hypothetical protein [Lactococcus garvieae]